MFSYQVTEQDPTTQVFDPILIPALVETLRMVLACPDRVALIALTVRNKGTVAEFLRIAGEYQMPYQPRKVMPMHHRRTFGYRLHTLCR